MSKKSCEAAESAESAVLRMARVNCKQHERTLEKMHILLYDGCLLYTSDAADE